MVRSLAIASALMVGGITFGAQQAAAVTIPPVGQTLAGQSIVDKAQYRYCRRWNRECRARWGGGWRYRRCMARHGC